ncbi:hypothetical protein [Angelakisella massiliensis]|uniref:hypothetical protein n=1 Tax=Angelakisella massiliensis TaxID=1871018 RepID=UPI0008F8FF9A|nr:hypothetical protein [Angelakisella massiliensis]
MKLKAIRIFFLAALALSLFVSIDLGLNVLYTLIPEFQDGIPSYSILQSTFGVFGSSWTRGTFFFAFAKAIWITFALGIVNLLLSAIQIWKK